MTNVSIKIREQGGPDTDRQTAITHVSANAKVLEIYVINESVCRVEIKEAHYYLESKHYMVTLTNSSISRNTMGLIGTINVAHLHHAKIHLYVTGYSSSCHTRGFSWLKVIHKNYPSQLTQDIVDYLWKSLRMKRSG